MSLETKADSGLPWRLAAGVTIDDRGGIIQLYVAESQRAFAMAGIAAEMVLDLVASVDTGTLTWEQFAAERHGRYDERRLREAWNAAVAGGILVPREAFQLPGPKPQTRVATGVGLLGDDTPTATLRRELIDLGIAVTEPGSRPALLVGVDDVGDDRALVELGRALPWPSVPWLPIQLLHERLSIGPLVFPGDTPCFECALTRRAAALVPDGERRWGMQRIRRPDHLDRRAATKLASVVVRTQLLALQRQEPPPLLAQRSTHDLARSTQSTSVVLDVPGCATCRLTDGLLS
jgi:bacteriocin biosynthesis cyclodehydratase domain-containing protein